MPHRSVKVFYIIAAVLLIGIFLTVLYRPIETIFHEQDLWWMVPVMSSITQGHSFFENLRSFLFDPYSTLYGDPWMNTYLSSVLSILGFQAKYFIFVSLALHFLCAFLLYSILRKLDLDFRIAFFSALTYLTMFIHFNYYTWPMSAHHLFVLLFSLLVFNLYFETTKRIDDNRNWKYLFWLTIFVNFLASFCQITILMLPAGILAHILISSKDGQERLKKYDIWLPLFLTYLGYPLVRFIYVGSPHLAVFLRMGFEETINVALFPVILLLGAGSLFLFRGILQLSCRYRPGKIMRNLCIAAIILYLLIFIAVYGRNDLVSPSKVKLYVSLSPYNIIRPFVIMFINFVSPLKAALSINSSLAYHVIPLQNNIIAIMLSLLFIVVFMGKYLFKHKGLIVFLIFYIVALRWMRIPTTILFSRHFLYITPLFSIVFCCSFIYIYDLIVDKVKLKKIAQEIILILIFIGLCVPNILAIKLEMFRGRMVNTFLIYDYIRISDTIKRDLLALGTAGPIKADDIYVEGIQPMPFKEYDWPGASDRRLAYDTFRYVFAQVFNDKEMINININRPGPAGKLVYRVKGTKILDGKGRNTDKSGRPFLVSYILRGYKQEDIGLITGGRDLRDWIKDIVIYYDSWRPGRPVEKVKYVSSVINDEIDDYDGYLSRLNQGGKSELDR
ncbi:MAG: hypothetical protein A2879_03325 [Omnitrophica WOR_2 bacterium RIFCSPHIGHO2_01_FULL_49_10]|nr:MAG: hypothetical protein A2879_03325 [Omnitrophica WOR_2 bacterium RIFCSPHIGHO2_01_FULL_49_10]